MVLIVMVSFLGSIAAQSYRAEIAHARRDIDQELCEKVQVGGRPQAHRPRDPRQAKYGVNEIYGDQDKFEEVGPRRIASHALPPPHTRAQLLRRVAGEELNCLCSLLSYSRAAAAIFNTYALPSVPRASHGRWPLQAQSMPRVLWLPGAELRLHRAGLRCPSPPP